MHTSGIADPCCLRRFPEIIRPPAMYPANIADDAHLKIAANNRQTTLRSPVSTGDTVLQVADGAMAVPGMLMTIDGEIVSVDAVSGNLWTVTRGFDGTAAACHASGRPVAAFIDAWHHNVLAEEIKAIETALGPGLSNLGISPGIISTAYDFPAQQPGGTLVAGSNAILLTPVPQGVSGTNKGHYLCIFGGTGTDEPVLITGGDAVSGAASGTVIVTCAGPHSGAWSIHSATAGIQEAICSLPAQGGIIRIPAAKHTLCGPVSVSRSYVRLSGEGFYSTWIETQYKAGPLFNFNFSGSGSGSGNRIEFMTIVGPNDPAATNCAVSINNQTHFYAGCVNISQVANGFVIADNNNSDAITLEQCWVSFFQQAGFDIGGSNSQFIYGCAAVGGPAASSGFLARKTGGLQMRNCYTYQTGAGLAFEPGAGQSASLAWIDSCIFDSSLADAVRLRAGYAGSQIHSVSFVNCYTTYSEANGVSVGTMNGGEIEEVSFSAHRSLLNKNTGIVVSGTKIRQITIDGSTITSNSRAGAGLSDGIFIAPAADGPDGITITGNTVGVSSYHAALGVRLRCGINFGNSAPPGAVDNVVCTGNRINNVTSDLYIAGLDVITGKNIVVADNLPDQSRVMDAVAVGALLNLGGSSVAMYRVTGTGSVNEIYPPWKGRRITITKTDATGPKEFNTSGATVNGFRNTVSLGDGESLTAVHDGTKWNLLK